MKIYLRTFGCRANQYDTEVIRSMVEWSGHEVTNDVGAADVAYFNSCAVTADAEADLRQAVRRAARAAPRLRSVVGGCAAGQIQAERRLRELPTVSDVIPGADFKAIARALDLPGDAPAATAAQAGSRAVLRIQDGCDEHCTFCATRIARGANRSRPMAELVREARVLAARHPEIVLTGIHIGSYGRDIGSSLGALVATLVAGVPDVRFRLSSLEATEVDERLRELWGAAPDRLAPFLHAPLQSGSDRVLRRMGRRWYTARSYRQAVERIAGRASVFGLGADVISGFPGESDRDHRATVALIDALPFTSLHVFQYSARPDTPATRLPDPVPAATTAGRAAELRALAADKAATYRHRRIGGTADVVVIGDGARRRGLTGDYLSVTLSDPTLPRGSRFDGILVEKAGELHACR